MVGAKLAVQLGKREEDIQPVHSNLALRFSQPEVVRVPRGQSSNTQ